MPNDRRFYVYAHRRKSDGSIFYIGKGCGDRLNHTHGKSKWWNSIVEKHGWYSEKLFHGLTECCAYSIEKILIHSNRGTLCNISSGGVGGLAGIKKSKDHIEKVAIAHTGMTRGSDTRKKISEKAKARLSQPRNHPRAKPIVGLWIMGTGERFIGSHFDVMEHYGFRLESLKKLQSGALNSYKGVKYESI